jgi:hypothetical protein
MTAMSAEGFMRFHFAYFAIIMSLLAFIAVRERQFAAADIEHELAMQSYINRVAEELREKCPGFVPPPP